MVCANVRQEGFLGKADKGSSTVPKAKKTFFQKCFSADWDAQTIAFSLF